MNKSLKSIVSFVPSVAEEMAAGGPKKGSHECFSQLWSGCQEYIH